MNSSNNNKLDHPKEKHMFVEAHNMQHWTKKQWQFCRLNASYGINVVIKSFPTNKAQDHMASQRILQTLKEEIIPILLKIFQKIEEKDSFQIHFKRQHDLDSNTRQKHYKRRILQTNIPDEYRWENPHENIITLKLKIHWKINQHDQLGLISGSKFGLISTNQSLWYTTLTNGRIKTLW